MSVILIADNVEFSAAAPTRVGMGQNFHLQYSLNQQANVQLPELRDFRVVGGPSVGTSTSVNIINNNVTRTTTYTYTYTLQATKTGSLTIPAASVNIGGKEYNSNAVSIEVSEEPVSTRSQGRQRHHDPWGGSAQGGQQHQPQQAEPQEITASDLYLRVHVNKTSPYRGEHIIATIKLYTRVDIAGFQDFTIPAFNSFWAEEIETPSRINMQQEVINGVAYNVGVIRKNVLFPRHSGEVAIEPSVLVCQVRQVVRGGGRSLIDQFFGQHQIITKTISSPEVKINVRELPTNHSPHFKGAVGNYNLSTNLSRDTLLMNEAVNLTVQISGTGNIRMLPQPEIVFPEEFEVYEPEVNNRINTGDNGVTGHRTWDFTIIPRYPGIYDLGQIQFEFFNPGTGRFQTLTSDPIVIAVRRDEHDKDFGKTVFNYNQQSIDYIGKNDIRFIRIGNLNLSKIKQPLVTSFEYKFLYIISSVIFIGFVITKRKQIKERANLALVRNKRANKVSRKRLKLAKKYMQNNNKQEFYKEVINALWGYLGDKLGIDVSDLKRERIIEELKSKNIEELISNKLLNIIDKCEYAHFAPVTEETEMETIYKESIEIIKVLENKLK